MKSHHADALIIGGAFVSALVVLFSDAVYYHRPMSLPGWIVAGIILTAGIHLVVGILKKH
jgi:ABC-type uncharacterized transport system permease subunit